jgi:hypothetical protein
MMNSLIPDTEIPYTNQEQSLLTSSVSRLEYFTPFPWQLFSSSFYYQCTCLQGLTNQR